MDSQIAAIDECRAASHMMLRTRQRACIGRGAIKLGVIEQSLEEALSSDGDLNKWYMHNTGHWLGIDVHDVGIYRPDDEPRLFEEGGNYS